jgi:hypothetical protein
MFSKILIAALSALLAINAGAQVCRPATPPSKVLQSEALERKVNNIIHEFRISYTASVKIDMCETGNCGAFGCNQKCVLASTDPEFSRKLEYKKAGDWIIVGQKTWTPLKPATQNFNKNCNETQRDNYPGVRDGYIGSRLEYDAVMKQDRIEVDRLIAQTIQ